MYFLFWHKTYEEHRNNRTGRNGVQGLSCYLEQEKVRGNSFTVDFRGELDLSAAADSDNLNHTVNYADIYEIISYEMSIPSELLENVAGRIVKEIEKRFQQFVSFSVRVSKKKPPVDGVAQWSRVTLYH